MADSIGIAVMGASGRMGRMLIDTIAESDRAHLIAVTEREGHPWIGRDLGEALGRGGWACRSMPTRSMRS
jgi:4-hydroxy-tetrahydrodipicolinate reductase